MVYSLHTSTLSSISPTPNPKFNSQYSSPHPPFLLRFPTSHRHNLRYLQTLGVIDSTTAAAKHRHLRSPHTVHQIIATVNFLKSKGFSDSDFRRIAFLCPQLFSPDFDPSEIAPVFDFLTGDLSASGEESCGLILRCPEILVSDVDLCLRPTLEYLRKLGLVKLNLPNSINAHLLDTPVQKLRAKIRFLRSIGLTYEESARVCARLPALFGYSVENNLRPKFEYLVGEMERSVEELKEFPQYFGFSLENRIMPRHLHLKQRSVRVSLQRMLLWSDQRFYAKWK